MRSAAPDIIAPRGLERGLVATILVSALLHVGAIGLLIAVPGRILHVPPRIQSYTVDLIAPNVIGGTNLVAGAGPKPAPPAAETGPIAVAPAEPKPAVSEAALPNRPEPAAPPKAVAAAEPVAAKPEPKPEPVKPAPEPPKAKPVIEPKPPVQAKVAPKPEPKPVAKAVEKNPVPAKPPAEAKAPAKPVAKPAKPEPAKPKAAEAKPEPKAKAEAKPAAAEAKPAAVPKPEAKAKAADPATKAGQDRDQAINAAIERRAAKADAAAKAEQQIAAAVQRRAAQVEKGGGGAAAGAGGPISSGPGSGAGGIQTDLQYILYHGRMIERIKGAWAWAGADRSLSAVVQFNIAPDGQVRNVRTIQSSGDASYDASAERAIRAVNPLEPVPDKYRDDFATIELTFRASDLES